MRLRAVLSIVAVCIGLCACVGSVREDMEHKGYNSSYSKGYEDGLSSGRHASGALGSTLQKNTYRYADDDQYRQGWDDGYDVGKTQEQQWKEDLNNSMRRIKPKKSK